MAGVGDGRAGGLDDTCRIEADFRQQPFLIAVVDEMVGDGIEAATRAVVKFDRSHEKKNPFGFLTFVIWRAFVNRLKLEKKLHEDKMKMMLDENFDGYERGEFDDHELSKSGMIGLYALND